MSKLALISPPVHRKRTAYDYHIRIDPQYAKEMLKGFRGEGAAQFFRQYTDELWSPPFSRFTCAEYGALRRLLAMFARSKAALAENLIIVTAKELKMFGITLRILRQICAKLDQIEISCVTDSGEIKDLHGS